MQRLPAMALFGSELASMVPAPRFTQEKSMTEERQEIITEDAAAPRWVGIVIVALAVVSLVALGAGWTASTRSKQLEQSLSAQVQQSKQNDDVISQRLAKAEDTNAQLEGELSVVTDKMKLTEGELTKARS